MKYILLISVVMLAAFAQPAQAISTFTIPAGWSLVSADVMFALYPDIDEFLNKGGAVFLLDPHTKKYFGGSGDSEKVLANIEVWQGKYGDGDVPAMGFWLYTPKTMPISVDFDMNRNTNYDRTQQYKDAYHFIKGWNLVGITNIMVGTSIADLTGSCTITSAYQFSKGEWYKQSPQDLSEKLTTDSLGHALAMKFENDCAFDFKKSVAVPRVPALPE